jgi:murein L,D-transpeptidase YcbB/YkuD
MTPRIAVLVLAAAVVLGCGGARKESRQEAQPDAREESPRGQRAGERTGRAERGEGAGSREEKEPRVPASPEALLGRDTVGNLQQALARRGLLREHQQGALDAPTQAAVRRFQQQKGLAATGVPDKETLRELGVNAEQAYGAERGGEG